MLDHPWLPVIIPGFHNCSLCPDPASISTYSHTIDYQHYQVTMGARNLLIPGNGVIYASPSLILHYILQHQYAPPLPFQEAVLNCPPMRSPSTSKQWRRSQASGGGCRHNRNSPQQWTLPGSPVVLAISILSSGSRDGRRSSMKSAKRSLVRTGSGGGRHRSESSSRPMGTKLAKEGRSASPFR